MQHVVDAVKMAGLLDGSDIRGFLHHAYKALVAGGVAAVGAGIDVGDVIADRAQAEIGLDVANGGGERFRIGVARAQDMEGEALGALASDPGQLFQFVNEPGHRLGKARHGLRDLISGDLVIG